MFGEWTEDHNKAFTKPPLFQRNGLTCRGNPLFESCAEGKAKQRPFKDHNTKPVLISCASLKMYTHGGFDRCSGCTLEFPSAELFPLHNFQKADCRCQWAYSFGLGEVWWMQQGCWVLTAAILFQKLPGSVKLTCPENLCHIRRRL